MDIEGLGIKLIEQLLGRGPCQEASPTSYRLKDRRDDLDGTRAHG